jgi:parvulin-like peptidyl-prolyl isomerase
VIRYDRTLILSAFGALAGLVLAGYALFTAKGTTAGLPPEDVAQVNGRPILQSDFVTQTQLETGSDFKDTTPAERRKVLDEMIDEELLVQRGLDVDLAASDPDVRSAMVTGVNLQVDAEVLATAPDEAALGEYYARHRDRYRTEGAMDLLDLVLPEAGQQNAEAAVALIRAGGSVEEAVRRFGLTESGKIGHGDNYDFGVKAKLGEKPYDVAALLKDGQISDPFIDAEQIHILVMLKRQAGLPLSFDEAHDQVRQDFQRDARAEVEQTNLTYLRNRADIRTKAGLRP